MAPRPTTPRLADINPVGVANDVTSAVTARARELSLLTQGDRATSPIFQAVAELARFAKTGEGMTSAGDLLTKVERAYYGSAAYRFIDSAPGDTLFWIGVVVQAAKARIHMAEDRPVPPRYLAALAGVHPSRIRTLSSGPCPTLCRSSKKRGATITHASARAWLIAQQVAGF